MLQRLAKEVGFSETTFVYPSGWPTRPGREGETARKPGASHRDSDAESTFVYPPEGDGHVRMRIFTPQRELPFAGHPTLGTAFVLAGPLQLIEIRIETQRGVVPVQLEREGARISFGTMVQPLPEVTPFDRTDELLSALGVE